MAAPISLVGAATPNGHSAPTRQQPGPADATRIVASPIEFELVRPLGAVTWLGAVAGRPIAARPFPADADDGVRARLAALPDSAAGGHLVSFEGLGVADEARWLLSEFVTGASLNRVLTVATLSAYQAATVATDVFAGLAALREMGATHGRFSGDAVHLGADGIVRITDWTAGALRSPAPGSDVTAADAQESELRWSADLEAAQRVVAELARNADRPVARHGGLETRLLDRLGRIGADDPARLAALSADELRQLVGKVSDPVTGPADVRRELATLVRVAMARFPALRSTPVRARPVQGSPKTQSQSQPPLPPTSDARLSTAQWPARKHRGRLVAVIAAIVVVAAAAVLAVRGPGRPFVDRLLHRSTTPSAGSGAAGSGTHHNSHRGQGGAHNGKHHSQHSGKRNGQRNATSAFHAVPILAPAAAGIVNGITMHPVSHCAPGKTCRVRVTINVTPAAAAQRVSWTATVVNRCNGNRSHPAGGVMIAHPGSTGMYATTTLRLPRAKALAAVAMTVAPVRVAAHPLLVHSSARHC
jgi:hypothetical protein